MDALERDFYEERRRKWRRSAFWRGFGAAFLLLILLGLIFGSDLILSQRSHIARIEVNGVISEDRERDEMLSQLAEAQGARAVLLRINSPGGTTAGSEALYEAIRHLAETRPVVAVLGEVAASGGYVAALGADHIVGWGNTLTGSIGVIMEYPDLTQVLDRLGIGWETVRSPSSRPSPRPSAPPTRRPAPATRRWWPRATPGSAASSANGAASTARPSTRWRTAASSLGGWRWRTG
jgi:protease-4